MNTAIVVTSIICGTFVLICLLNTIEKFFNGKGDK